MKAIWLSFRHMLRFITRDMMLFAAGLAPILAGLAIHFLVPLGEKMLIQLTGLPMVLTPYYGLFDIFFASIAPAMFCFIAAMVMLEEHDDHMDVYLFVTGLGRRGYLVSRIVLPAILAFVVTVVLLPLFKLTDLSFFGMLMLSLTGTLQGIIIALMVVTLSSNKLEGMAVTKLSTLIILGAVLPYFVPKPVCFFGAFLPSFWMGMATSWMEKTSFYPEKSFFWQGMVLQKGNYVFLLMSAIIAGIWIWVLLVRFRKKR